MPKVNAKHRSYLSNVGRWNRCRAAFEGEDAIRAGRELYQPKPEGMSGSEYEAYLLRGSWFGAVERTVRGLGGAILRRPTTWTVPSRLEPYLSDVTLSNVSVDRFQASILDEQLLMGRVGALVDFPSESNPQLPNRPYLVSYRAEDIINWRTIRIEGRQMLSLVVLLEDADVPTDDYYVVKREPRIRTLELRQRTQGEDNSLMYVQQVWRPERADQGLEAENWVPDDELRIPDRSGQPLDFLPFVLFGSDNVEPAVDKPPLLDLVNTNLAHWRNSCDYEQALYYCGGPVYYGTGVDRDEAPRVGPGMMLTSEKEHASFGKLSGSAEDVGALSNALEQKQRLMAVQGARMLEEQKRAAEAADTVRLRQAGESATLQGIADGNEAGFRQLMDWFVWWADGQRGQGSCSVNRDYVDASLTPDEIRSYMEMLQGNGSSGPVISYKTFYQLLERGELTRDGVDAEEELAEIDLDQEGELQNIQNRLRVVEGAAA